MKLYATKSNARRAAKQGGLEQFNIIEVEGKFGFEAVQETPVVDEIPAKVEPVAKEAMKGVPYTGQSTVTNPVKAVWHIADEMFDAAEKAGEEQPRRKDVIAECVNRGIAFYTARTQYQQWWLCRNGKF